MTEKQRLIEAFKNFKEAAAKLNEVLEFTYNPYDLYPFPQCFEELTLEVFDWVDHHVEYIESGKAEIVKHYTTEELLTKCPDCGSANIQIYDGPLLHYVAKRSDQCNDCGTIWKVD